MWRFNPRTLIFRFLPMAALLAGACQSVDPDHLSREALARAEQDPTAAYQAFLDTGPRGPAFSDAIQKARTVVEDGKRAQLLALDLEEQAAYLSVETQRFAREEVLGAALVRLEGLSRVEQIQWASRLASSCGSASEENLRRLRSARYDLAG